MKMTTYTWCSQQPHYTTIDPSHSMRCAGGQSALDDSYEQRNNRERLLGSFGIMEASWDVAGGRNCNDDPGPDTAENRHGGTRMRSSISTCSSASSCPRKDVPDNVYQTPTAGEIPTPFYDATRVDCPKGSTGNLDDCPGGIHIGGWDWETGIFTVWIFRT